MDATHEEWRPVVGYEGSYEVSSLGRVRSVDRIVTFKDGRKRLARGRVLRSWSNNLGHQVVGLANRQRAFIHCLVLEAFVGPRPDGLVACHNNGQSTDNRVENLRWDTYSENNLDLVRHGTHWQVSKTHCPQGHEYTDENTRLYYYRGSRYRYCRTCQGIASRMHKTKARSALGIPPRGSATHCQKGHPFDEANTHIRPDGRRLCKTCRREGLRAWRKKGKREYEK